MKKHKYNLRDIRSIQVRANALELSTDARKRLRWFNYYMTHNYNVSLTCRYYGIARSTFIRWSQRFDPKNPSSLEEYSKSPHTVRRKETPVYAVGIIRELRSEMPHICRNEIAKHLSKQYGVTISIATIGRIIQDQGMFFGETNSHREKRKAWIATQDSNTTFHHYKDTDTKEFFGDTSLHLSPA